MSCTSRLVPDGLPRSRCTAQEAFRTQVLVHVGPVDAISTARDRPLGSLRRGGMEQPRIPGERDCDRTAVKEFDLQLILAELDMDDLLTRAHDLTPPDPCDPASPPTGPPRFRRAAARWPGVPYT